MIVVIQLILQPLTPDVTEPIKRDLLSEEEISNVIGTYIEIPTDKMLDTMRLGDDSSLSKITLNKDETCTFIYNCLDDMVTIDATYEIIDNHIIIDNYNRYLAQYTHPKNKISFTIVSDNEIYFNSEVYSVYGYNDRQE